MPKPANFFRIGVFILIAAAILIAAVVIFGAGQLFKQKITFETYVKGSIQGVDVGSPVKFRGVQVGQVNWIGFSLLTYPQPENTSNKENYVIIRMVVDKEIFPNMFDEEDLQPVLDRGVQKGLRARIEPQGITGMNYIELNFLEDPNQFPLISYDWKPDNFYIPSAPGELANILTSMNKIMRDLEKLNLGDIQGGVVKLLENLNKAVTEAEIQKISVNLQTLLDQMNKAITDANIGPLSNDARTLMAGLQRSNDDLQKVLKNVEPATRFNPGEVRAIVNNLADITRNLEAFSQSIKERPSLLLYGSPPTEKPTPEPRKRR